MGYSMAGIYKEPKWDDAKGIVDDLDSARRFAKAVDDGATVTAIITPDTTDEQIHEICMRAAYEDVPELEGKELGDWFAGVIDSMNSGEVDE